MRGVLQQQPGPEGQRGETEPPQWQRFSGSIAERYHRYLVPVIFEPWAADLVGLAAPRPGERVLDVACGPGVVARHAARQAGAGFRDMRIQPRAKVLRFPSPAEFVAQYAGSSPVGAVLGDAAGDRLGPVTDEVTGALAPFTGPDGLTFRIENQLAQAVRLGG